jgi:hypothetical protein
MNSSRFFGPICAGAPANFIGFKRIYANVKSF